MQQTTPRKASSFVGVQKLWTDSVTGRQVYGTCLQCRIGINFAYLTISGIPTTLIRV